MAQRDPASKRITGLTRRLAQAELNLIAMFSRLQMSQITSLARALLSTS